MEVKNDDFIRPPRDAQRNSLLNGLMKEISQDLSALDTIASDLVPGEFRDFSNDRTQSALSEDEIMEDWQIPLMEVMSDFVCESQGDVLEIGFGRGISSSCIQERGVKSHTIIECNDKVIEDFNFWKQKYPTSDIRLVKGLWQDTISSLGLFDSIFFHTYPLNEEEYMNYVYNSVTFAAHFFRWQVNI